MAKCTHSVIVSIETNMRSIAIILFIFFCINGYQTYPTKEAQWESFKVTYGKKYDDSKEDAYRKELFLKKLQQVEAHNQKYELGLISYKAGINKFSDYTEEEKSFYTKNNFKLESKKPSKYIFTHHQEDDDPLPDSIDWREQGIVPPVKNQGPDCGSCWAFATVGATECHYRLYKKNEVSLSEQQAVDCVKAELGCRGGISLDAVYVYMKDNGGLNTESDYPYEGVDGECRYRPEKPHYNVSGFVDIAPGREDHLKAAVAKKGPVAVIVDASGNFDMYESGIYYDPDCNPNFLTHAMVVVGYGTENGEDYWLVRNSFTDQWGDHGYVKMARNRNNQCGITSMASYPVI